MLKKEDPHIAPNKIKRKKSKLLDDLISIKDCIDVKYAYLLYLLINLKRTINYYLFPLCKEKKIYECKKRIKINKRQRS